MVRRLDCVQAQSEPVDPDDVPFAVLDVVEAPDARRRYRRLRWIGIVLWILVALVVIVVLLIEADNRAAVAQSRSWSAAAVYPRG